MAVIDQPLRDQPGRVREVQQPGTLSAQPGRVLGDLQHHRHRAKRLREAARPGRLLADAAELGRDRLVLEPRPQPAHAQLDEHEVGALDGTLAVGRERQPAGELELAQDPLGQSADHVQPLPVDVVQHQLLHRQHVSAKPEALHQLGRVGASSPDHRHFHEPPASYGILGAK